MILIVSGAGGAGKSALLRELLRRDDRLWLSRSWTTRPARSDDASDWYTYTDRATFERRVEEGGFLEWEEFLGHLYGTPVPDPPPGKDIVLEIELDGARQVKQRFPDAVMVFVVPPSRAEQEQRLVDRGDPPERVAERLASADEREPLGRAMADHVVVNDDLGRVVQEVAGIVEMSRSPSREST